MSVPCLHHDFCGLAGCIHVGGSVSRTKIKSAIKLQDYLSPKSRTFINGRS